MSLSEDVKLQIRLIKSLPYLGPDSPHMGDDGELSSCLGNISYNIKEARRIINRNKEYAQYYKEE